ncbi:MAG: DoxX family protein [Gammaproteobacteria bacterium]|nr:DoxX family protein [Gammaproteobacteria bacterium]MDH3449510.1 DoxX family protein [Gammaproteobacteria bacterium]
MIELVEKLDAPTQTVSELLSKLQAPFLLFIRIYVAWVFLKSGMHKIGDWETTLVLFEYEYQVPFLPFELAAYLATFGELVFPVFLIAGLGTRYSAIALSFVNIMAVVSYYATLAKGAGLVWHYLWGSMLFTSVIFGGGLFSIDQWIRSRLGRS